jgi:hypothetical protein
VFPAVILVALRRPLCSEWRFDILGGDGWEGFCFLLEYEDGLVIAVKMYVVEYLFPLFHEMLVGVFGFFRF